MLLKWAPYAVVLFAAFLLATPAQSEQDLEWEVYGFAKADAVYDFKRVHPDWSYTLRPSQIIIRDADTPYYDDGELVFSVRATRLGTNLIRRDGAHLFTARLEVDFLGVGTNAGQHMPRLRQAFVSYGDLLVGQTWSLFNDSDVWPIQMDFWGPCGLLASRRPQVRWTAKNTDSCQFKLALEQPGAGVDAGKGPQYDPNLDVRPRSVLPDFTASYRRKGDWGHWQLAGVARALGYEGSTTIGMEEVPFTNTEFGWGLYLTTRVRNGQQNGLNASLAYGEGIANYANDGGVDVGPDADIEAVALPYLGWHVSYDQWWNARWSSSLGCSGTHQDNSEGQTGEAFKTGLYAFHNLVYHPESGLSYGLELLWGQLERHDERKGNDYRLNFAAKYAF
jgi:hypothetical protein